MLQLKLKTLMMIAMILLISVQTGRGEEATLNELLGILASPDSAHNAKWNAVHKIRLFGNRATTALIELVRKDQGGSRFYAIWALGYIKDPMAVDILSRILNDPSYGSRRYAAIALGQIGDPKAVDALKKALRDVAYVRKDALDALIKIGSEEAVAAITDYHFSNTASDLQLKISLSKSVYLLGEAITIAATLTNVSPKSFLLAVEEGKPFGYLVFLRKNGNVVEEVDTGLRESRVVQGKPLRDFPPGADLRCSFTGLVDLWKRGEKDDHSFVVSGDPFLTLNFRSVAFHLRQPGEYQVRHVFKQGDELLGHLKAAGAIKDDLERMWQGKAVSEPVDFLVARH